MNVSTSQTSSHLPSSPHIDTKSLFGRCVIVHHHIYISKVIFITLDGGLRKCYFFLSSSSPPWFGESTHQKFILFDKWTGSRRAEQGTFCFLFALIFCERILSFFLLH